MFQAWLVKIAKIAAHSAPSVEPGNSAEEKSHREGQKPRIGTDCSTSSSGTRTRSARRLLAAQRRVSEGEDQRDKHRREHPQRRAQGIIGQVAVIERQAGGLLGVQRQGHAARAVAHQHEHAQHQNERREIPQIGKRLASASGEQGDLFLRHAANRSGSSGPRPAGAAKAGEFFDARPPTGPAPDGVDSAGTSELSGKSRRPTGESIRRSLL